MLFFNYFFENFPIFFGHNKKYFSMDIQYFSSSFFLIYLLYQSYPTHLLSTPESQPGGIGHGKSVGNPEICQWS